jgi:hypothetical protein
MSDHIPSYRLHRQIGQAIVTLADALETRKAMATTSVWGGRIDQKAPLPFLASR